MRRLAAVAILTAWLVAGCDVTTLLAPAGGTYPEACESLGFSARQCAAIVARAQEDAGIAPGTATSIEILPPPTEGSAQLGGRMIARVRFHQSTAAVHTEEVWCVGVGSDADRVCRADAQIDIMGGVDHDVPCQVGPPETCATPPPSARPAPQASAQPLRVPSLDIPLAHLGRYEVEVGPAGLPDGVLSERSATLADPRPDTFWIADGIRLEVRSVDPARPPVGSVYREPFDGVEPVNVFLVFEVTELTSPSVLQVRNLVVE